MHSSNQVAVNDKEWNYVDTGSAVEAGPTLLLVHGFPLDHSMWRHQIDDLGSEFRVVAPDLVGFGKSSSIKGTLSMSRLADDLAAFLDQLEVKSPVAFCGLSMGGYIGWQMWKRHRARLSHLIQCDTRAVADSVEVARGRQMMAANIVHDAANGIENLVTGLVPKLFAKSNLVSQAESVEQTRGVIRGTDCDSIAAAQLGMAERDDFAESLAQIDLPTLFVCGEHDVISLSDEMRGIAERVPGGKFVEIADAGHMAPLENPAAVNQAIRDFFAEESRESAIQQESTEG